MKEKAFITILKKALNKKGGWYYKIPDVGYVPDKQRFYPKRPFDIIYVIDGVPCAIEAKVLRQKSATTKLLQIHQIDALREFRNAGGMSYVAFKLARGYSVIEFSDFISKKKWTIDELIEGNLIERIGER